MVVKKNRCIVHVTGDAQLSPLVRSFAQSMLCALGLEKRELSLWLCNDREIRQLNREHRGIDKSTDVLAFAQDETLWPHILGNGPLGDIAISVPTARRQAKFHNVSARHELAHLLAHGLLHLLGFDHAEPNEKRRMKACTDALLASVKEKPASDLLWQLAIRKDAKRKTTRALV